MSLSQVYLLPIKKLGTMLETPDKTQMEIVMVMNALKSVIIIPIGIQQNGRILLSLPKTFQCANIIKLKVSTLSQNVRL